MTIRDKFARIIDPLAFPEVDGIEISSVMIARAQKLAFQKADELLALQFEAADMPDELRKVVAALEETMGQAQAKFMLGPMVSRDGRPVYNALVRPEADGSLMVMVLYREQLLRDDEEPCWIGETLQSDEARKLSAEIEVAAAGGGTA